MSWASNLTLRQDVIFLLFCSEMPLHDFFFTTDQHVASLAGHCCYREKLREKQEKQNRIMFPVDGLFATWSVVKNIWPLLFNKKAQHILTAQKLFDIDKIWHCSVLYKHITKTAWLVI